jgi:cytochrome c2
MKRKTHFNIFILILLSVISTTTYSQPSSETSGVTLYKANCAACHNIGKGKLVGPDLKGISDRRQEAWLLKWIKSSQSLVKSGDPDAVAVFNENNKIAMQDFPSLSDEQIKSILDYIKNEGSGLATTAVAAPAVTNTDPKTNQGGFSLSLTNIMLLALIVLMLFIIFMLTRTIGKLTDELGDYYDNDKAFFKK